MKNIFEIAKQVKKEMLVVESLKIINEEYKKQEKKFIDDYNSVCRYAFVQAHKEDIPQEKVLEKYKKQFNKDFLEWQKKWEPYKGLII
jgi:ribosomal protein S17E